MTKQAATRVSAEPQYGPAYFRDYWGGGGPYERNEHWLGFFDGIADNLVREFHPTSVLDAGCAMGFLVESLRKRGVNASGVDISEYAISRVDDSVAEHCRVGSLTEPLSARYDLITCIEVLEHLPPEEIGTALDNLCAATDRLVISSTPGDFGEPTHLNVQPPEAWSAMLANRGFFRDLDRDLSYISPWASIYIRQKEDQEETVRRYDRAWWRHRQEVSELRDSLLASRHEITELRQRSAEEGATPAAEIEARDAEILRLRDLLMGMEGELGVARGKLAQIEDRDRRITNAKRNLESKVPGGGRMLTWALRLRRLLLGGPK